MADLFFRSKAQDLASLLGLDPSNSQGLELLKGTISNPAGDALDSLDNFLIKGDYRFDFEVGLELDLGTPQFGDLVVDYPVGIFLDAPQSVSTGETLNLRVDDDFSIEGAQLEADSLTFDDIGLDVFFSSDGAEFLNGAAFNTVFGSALDLPDLSIPGFSRTDIRLLDFTDGAFNSSPFPGVVLQSGGRVSADDSPIFAEGELPSIVQPTRDKLFEVRADPLRLLAELVPGFQQLALLTPKLPGVSFEAFNKEITATFSATLFSPFVGAGFDVLQEFEFVPSGISASYNVEGIERDLDFEDDLNFDLSEVVTAALADGRVDGFVDFDLSGDIVSKISVVPTGAIGFKALSLNGRLEVQTPGSTDKPSVFEIPIGPLFSGQVNADAEGFVISENRVPLDDDAFDAIRVPFSIPVLEPTAPELNIIPRDIFAAQNAQTLLPLQSLEIFDLDTVGDLELKLRASSGTLSTEVPTTLGGLQVFGNNSRLLVLDGTETEINAFLSSQSIFFNPGSNSGDVTLEFQGNDRDGFRRTDLGEMTISVVEDPNIEEAQSGGLGDDTLTAFDLNNDGELDEEPAGNVAVAFSGGGGNDRLVGGNRADLLDGGTGDDLVTGGDGNDTLRGGDGNDSLNGGADSDIIDGGAGEDTIGAAGDGNRFLGGAGRDTLGGSGNGNFVDGGLDDDRVESGGARDTLLGGAGRDFLFGNAAGNTDMFADAGPGNDTVLVFGTRSTIFGGEGNDTITLADAPDELVGGAGNDSIRVASQDGQSYEAVGNAGDDVIFDDDADASLIGGAGNDFLVSGDGDDLLEGGAGNDNLDGATRQNRSAAETEGADTLLGGEGDDTLFGRNGDLLLGEEGDDVLNGTAGDTLRGGEGNDTLRPEQNTSVMDGGLGNDFIRLNGSDEALEQRPTLVGGEGDDTLDASLLSGDAVGFLAGAVFDGGSGNDSVEGSNHSDLYEDFLGNNFFNSFGTGQDTVRTGDGADTIIAVGGGGLISSGAGDDSIFVNGGGNTVRGGEGNDILRGSHFEEGEAPNLLIGGAGNDTFEGSLFGGQADEMRGGAGDDDFQRVGFGVDIDGGDGLDALTLESTRNINAPLPLSITVDMKRGELFNSTDRSEITTFASIELVEVSPRGPRFGDRVEDLRGLSDELDLALTSVNAEREVILGQVDLILGSAGNDTIGVANNGHARVEGKGGDDFLIGFDTAESADAGRALEVFLDGGVGADTVIGGIGNDTIVAGLDDVLDGRAGRDLLDLDSLGDGPGLNVDLGVANLQFGLFGDEVLDLAGFEDILGRDGGDDTLTGNEDTRRIDGQGGDDILAAPLSPDAVTLTGGDGNDTAIFTVDFAIVASLNPAENPFTGEIGSFAQGNDFFFFGHEAVLEGIENAVGGFGDDEITGDDGANLLAGESGDDTLIGLGGRDTLLGSTGADLLDGGAGADVLTGGAGNDTLRGGAGADVFSVFGDFGTDTIEDFDPSQDRLEVAAERRADLVFTAFGSFDTRVTLRDAPGTVILRGVTPDLAPDGVQRVAIAQIVQNTPPEARDDAFEGSVEDVLAGNVLEANGAGRDRDEDDDALSVTAVNGGAAGQFVTLESGARIRIKEDGSLRYDPNGAFDGLGVGETFVDRVTYTITDGVDFDTATVEISVQGPAGPTGGADDLTGTGADERIDAKGGNDTVQGAGGDDTLLGSNGRDELSGQNGADRLVGGSGRDTLSGGNGADTLIGNGGADLLDGGAGSDALIGGGGFDTARYADASSGVTADLGQTGTGGAAAGDTYDGVEALIGSGFADRLTGTDGANQLDGGAGADTLIGGSGRDTLIGAEGRDLLRPGDGRDEIRFGQGDGKDAVRGFVPEEDRLSLSADLLDGATRAGQVIRSFAEVTADGVLLDFGRDELLLEGLDDLTALRDAIDIA